MIFDRSPVRAAASRPKAGSGNGMPIQLNPT